VLALAPLPSAILGALAGGVVVTLAFSFVILGLARFDDMRRSGRSGAAAAYATLGLLAGLVAVGTVVLGLVVLTAK
jgi:uncharacterized membrane protein YjfL (UPF0719 family)